MSKAKRPMKQIHQRKPKALHPAPAPPPRRLFSRHFILCTYCAHMFRTTRFLHPAPAPPPHRLFSRHFILCTYCAHMLRTTRFLHRAPAPPPPPRFLSRRFIPHTQSPNPNPNQSPKPQAPVHQVQAPSSRSQGSRSNLQKVMLHKCHGCGSRRGSAGPRRVCN